VKAKVAHLLPYVNVLRKGIASINLKWRTPQNSRLSGKITVQSPHDQTDGDRRYEKLCVRTIETRRGSDDRRSLFPATAARATWTMTSDGSTSAAWGAILRSAKSLTSSRNSSSWGSECECNSTLEKRRILPKEVNKARSRTNT
jgi:hypothetical protein